MKKHQFIFRPGKWLGEGDVSFNTSSEKLHFYMRWEIAEKKEGKLVCEQLVEMQGVNEKVRNRFILSEITPAAFAITLENDLVGQVEGKGVIEEKSIGWEFRAGSGLEGFETYKLRDNDEYEVHAEYASPDQFRSIIEGRIWKK